MKYDPNKHHRHLIRLQNGNYARGTYFVTICLDHRIPKNFAKDADWSFPTFGRIENDNMVLNDAGKIVQQIWNEIPQQYKGVKIGEFIIMPDHIHGIIEIANDQNYKNTIQCVKQQNDPSRRGAIYRDQQQCAPENTHQPPVPHPHQQTKLNYGKQHYGDQDRNEPNYGKNEEYERDEEYGDRDSVRDVRDAINRVPTGVLSALSVVEPVSIAKYFGPAKGGVGGFAGVKNPMFHINLARIVRWFKGRITFECHKINCDFKWQRNYYEHIIRDERAYKNISQYIVNNPRNWQKDKFYKQGGK